MAGLRTLLLVSVALIAATTGCSTVTTTVLLVRHAEKGAGRDPDLTPEGRHRAQALVEVARRAGVVAAYHTQFKRSKQTAEPLASGLGIPLIQIDCTPGKEAEHAEALIRNIQANYPGRTVLVVGHTTTLPVIMEKLGVPSPREIPETEYGTLFVVTGKKLSEAKFGP